MIQNTDGIVISTGLLHNQIYNATRIFNTLVVTLIKMNPAVKHWLGEYDNLAQVNQPSEISWSFGHGHMMVLAKAKWLSNAWKYVWNSTNPPQQRQKTINFHHMLS